MNIEFCSECNNILYPKEDNTEAQLTLICKTCDHIQEASTNRIASFHYKTRPTGFKTYAKELAKDPTLPKINQICSNCENNVVVYFQNRDNEEEIAFDLVYICYETHMENKSFLLKRLEKALILRESLNKTLDQIQEEFINTESHVRTLLPLLYKSKPGLQLNKQNTFPFVPSPHITDFPFFARNSKYILALYNTGLPVKCIIPNPLPLVIYTNGFHSKRMYYKHKCHKDKDDNYIFYTCITRVVNNRLMFEIKTDDGLYILDNKLGAHETMLGLFKRKYEFEDIEDFFGLSSREIIDFIKLKFENK